LERLYANRHLLDWYNQPSPYKIYSSLDPIPLPGEFTPSSVSALDAIAASSQAGTEPRVPDLDTVARLCFFSNGVTKRLQYAGGQMEFRPAACTGALYHIELYIVCTDLPGLAAGVYHYCAHEHVLRRLRAGDFRRVLADASGDEPSLADAPAAIVCTSTFWRNAWKYQARAYRHCFWDNGTILANLLAVAAAAETPARVILGFADATVNRLLDVDERREAAISLVAIGSGGGPPPSAPPVTPLSLSTVPLSRTEVDYPEIRAMHAASSLQSSQEATSWRGQMAERPLPQAAGPPTPLDPLSAFELPEDPIETVIRRRGSTRRFARTPIGFRQLSAMIERATASSAADCLDVSGSRLSDVYLIANAVDGLASGAYVLHRDKLALELLRAGDFRPEAERLDLGQELAGDAAANVYFLVDLEAVLARFGNRGYRAAELAAAIAAGRLYLAAYALRVGATGLTFFDDDVTEFFSPHAAGKSVMFLMAIGQPLRRQQLSS
jgi:SagB-type dehydrogenase family enzyme